MPERRPLKAEANANLIAAAPELLAALERIRGIAAKIICPDQFPDEWFEVGKAATAAIAKVKGD